MPSPIHFHPSSTAAMTRWVPDYRGHCTGHGGGINRHTDPALDTVASTSSGECDAETQLLIFPHSSSSLASVHVCVSYCTNMMPSHG